MNRAWAAYTGLSVRPERSMTATADVWMNTAVRLEPTLSMVMAVCRIPSARMVIIMNAASAAYPVRNARPGSTSSMGWDV
ncbi:hypothetical protein AGMMS49992_22800 [Clostridia bacterium]|nr:hypothetical protein AGMMS49992_22800 [Clostridia bacterium]